MDKPQNIYRFAARRRERKYRAKKRNEAMDKLGGKCVRCGFSDRRALVFDHVQGDGFVTKGILTSANLSIAVLDNESGRFQLLCANCNMIKAYENNEWQKNRPTKSYTTLAEKVLSENPVLEA